MVEKKAVEHKKPGRLTFRAVNAALAAAGAAEVLAKGDGYFYFMEGDAHCWPATMVYVTRLNDLTVEQWIGEWRSLRADWRWRADSTRARTTSLGSPVGPSVRSRLGGSRGTSTCRSMRSSKGPEMRAR